MLVERDGRKEQNWRKSQGSIHTATTESRAATARMSAHDTVWLQTASTWDLMVSTTSKPLTELRLGTAVFSPVNVEVSSSSKEPSQPCNGILN